MLFILPKIIAHSLNFYSVASIKETHIGHKDTFTPDDEKLLDRFLYPIMITIV